MKDILFEKFGLVLMDAKINETSLKDAAVACANTTKEIAKGFAEWKEQEYWQWYNPHEYRNRITGELQSTEQLLEKYLLTLNQ